MNTVPENAYDTDFTLTNFSMDPQYMSLLASASAYMPWPDATDRHVPGHLIPGTSYLAHTG